LYVGATQIDPDEHEKALKKLDELKKECESLKSTKENAEKASVNAKALITRLNKELTQQRALVDAQKKKTAVVSSKASTDAIQERDQMKVRVEKLEKEAVENKKALEGSSQIVETFKKHLRNYQKQIGELKEQVSHVTSELEASNAKLETARSAPAPTPVLTARAASPKEPMSLENPEPAAAANMVPDTTDLATKATTKATPTDAPEADTLTNATEVEPAAKTPPEVPPGGFHFGPGGSLKPTPSKIPRKTQKEVSPRQSGNGDAKQEAVAAQGLGKSTVKPKVTTTQKSPPSLPKVTTAQKPPSLSPARVPDEPAAATAEIKSDESAFREKLLLLKKRKAELMKVKEERPQKRALIAQEATSEVKGGDEATTKPEEAGGGQELVAAGYVEGEGPMPTESQIVEKAVETLAFEQAPPETSAPGGEGAEPKEIKKVVDESKEETSSSEIAKATPIESKQETPAPDASTSKAEPTKAATPAKASLFGGPSTFGSVSTFGNKGAFGMTGFGKPAPSLAFGSSSTIAETSTEWGEGPSVLAPSSFGSTPSTDTPAAFGSGGTFLDIKPPGSTAPKFSFGSSPNITLPTPAKGLPVASGTSFGMFGHGPSGASPFGGGMVKSSQAQPLFGDPAKRPHPDAEGDEGQERAAKQSRIEETEVGGEQQDVGDDDEADLEEGEYADDEEAEE
jgi:hypothetical protein